LKNLISIVAAIIVIVITVTVLFVPEGGYFFEIGTHMWFLSKVGFDCSIDYNQSSKDPGRQTRAQFKKYNEERHALRCAARLLGR